MPDHVLHLLPNAHLDPVWLWDWREGLNEGIVTCRTMLDLMERYEELTFIRGEAVIYRHLAEHDPQTLERIREKIAEGRWDVVGGTWLQPDTNLPAAETFARHFLYGQQWFSEHLRQQPRIVWTADSFGHAAGLPEIYAAAGMEGVAFSRPPDSACPIDRPLFWWEGNGGSRILAWRLPIGWYGSERHGTAERLDAHLAAARELGQRTMPVFFGVGNHGGGATARQIEEILRWRDAHPEVTVTFSGLHRLFAAFREELAERPELAAVHRGEINFVLRGCYVSGYGVKRAYRRAEAALQRIETVDSAIAAACERPPAELRGPWLDLLFNSFHDILPGSSIEPAMEEQEEQLGGLLHATRKAELTALNSLAARVDTSVPAPTGDMPARVPRLLFNPHPYPWRGPVEIEAHLDYRPIFAYQDRADAVPIEVRDSNGQPVHFQRVEPEHRMMPELPWRVRAVVQAEIPPLGWAVYDIGYVEEAQAPTATTATTAGDAWIANEHLRVAATVGNYGIAIDHDGAPLLDAPGLAAVTVEDPYGSWGEMSEAPESLALSDVRERWRVEQVRVLDSGPLRATLWVRLAGAQSSLELTCHLYAERPALDIEARLLWQERGARLKLLMPTAGEALRCEVPGAIARRANDGREGPGGRWAQVDGQRPLGFASDTIYGFDLQAGTLRASIIRGSGFATTGTFAPEQQPWRPTLDAGRFRFRALITHAVDELPRLAAHLAQPPLQLHTPPTHGDLPRSGTLGELTAPLRLLALKPAEDADGWVLRVQNPADQPVNGTFTWQGQPLSLGELVPWRLHTWRLRRDDARWLLEPEDLHA